VGRGGRTGRLAGVLYSEERVEARKGRRQVTTEGQAGGQSQLGKSVWGGQLRRTTAATVEEEQAG
jgi:hypothetical protein